MSINEGEYTCEIDDGRGVKTIGYLYVEGRYISRKILRLFCVQ